MAGGAGGAGVVGLAPGRLTLNPRTGPPILTDGLTTLIVVLVLVGVVSDGGLGDLGDCPCLEVSSRALVGTLRVVLERSSTGGREPSSPPRIVC